MILIISCSLHPKSRSRILATELHQNCSSELLDLRDYNLPFCDGSSSYEDKNVIRLTEQIGKASKIVLAFPIYNFDASATAKNLIELTGEEVWQGKTFTFLCSAGGKRSYLAPLGLANSLQLDYRCIFLPQYIFADASCFNSERSSLTDTDVKKRIKDLALILEK